MFSLILFPLLLTSIKAYSIDSESCEGIKSDFDVRKAIGPWHAVAFIPDSNYSWNFDNNSKCYQVDFSEVDEAGLKWMIHQRFGKLADSLIDNKKGEVIRLRFHTNEPFDIWSKAVPGVKGCYKQLLDLSSYGKNMNHTKTWDSGTLFHPLVTDNGVFLLQMLWGRISAIIYRREPGITIEQLRPVYEFLSLYRRKLERPKICNATVDLTTKRPQFSSTVPARTLQ